MTSRRRFSPEVGRLDGRILLSHAGLRHASAKARAEVADPATTPTEGNTVYNLATWDALNAGYLAEAKSDRPRVEFLGDSITYLWNEAATSAFGQSAWNSTIAPLGAGNYGIPGDRTQNLLWRVENGAVASHPKVVVLMIGINNLGLGASPGETAAGVSAVVDAIHRGSPRTKVLLLGLLPAESTNPSLSNANIAATDAILADSVGKERFVSYLDPSASFERADGSPDPALYQDGLHPSSEGYQVLANDIVGPIEALLGGKARV